MENNIDDIKDNLQIYIRKYNDSRLNANIENSTYTFIQIVRKVIERRRLGENIPFIDSALQKKIVRYKRITIADADKYIAILSEYLYRKNKGILDPDERKKRLGLK